MENASLNGSLTLGRPVTFLFTDIEDSTQLRDQDDVFISAHHQIIRDALSKLNVYKKELQQ